MTNFNFLSKSSSRSCGHRVTTLALTVGSPSAHRRGTMLRLISVLVLILTVGVGNVWGVDYTLTTSLTEGDYVIGAVKGSAGTDTHIYAFTNTDNSSWAPGTETTPSGGKISDPSSSIVWHLTPIGNNGFSLKNGTKYLTIGTGTGSVIRYNSTSSGTIYFASTGSNSTFEISGASSFTVSSGNQVGYNIGNGYRQYAQRTHSTNTGSGQISVQFRFYKKVVSCTNPTTLLSISSSNTATLGTNKTLTTNGGNNGTVTWTVANGTGSATIAGNILTPTSAGTVTVTATQDDNEGKCGKVVNQTITISKTPATITLSEAGETSSVSGTHYGGDSYTLPSSTSASCGDKVLVGWSTVEIPTEGAKPTSNYYDKGASATLAAGSNTFYAVFAKASGNGSSEATKVYSGANNADYQFSTGSDSENGSLVNTTGYTAGKVNFKFSKGSASNWPYYDGSCVRFYKNSSFTITPLDGATITRVEIVRNTGTNSNGGTISTSGLTASTNNTTTNTNVYTGEATSAITFTNDAQCRFTALNITYTYSSVTYTKYATTCCTSLGSINGSVSENQQNSLVLKWKQLSDQVSSWAVTYREKNSGNAFASVTTSSTTTETIETVVYNKYTISGLAAGKTYEFKLTPTLKSGVCALSEDLIVEGSTQAAYTITAASSNTDHGTVSLNGVVITATPATGYGYASPAYTVTSGTATVSQNGNEFTVSPSSNCTVQINFEQQNYAVTMAKDPANASVTISGNQSSKHYGDEITVSVTNHDGYLFTGWTASPAVTFDDASAETAKFTMPNSDVAVTANFCKIYSVAEALEIIDALQNNNVETENAVYVSGIVTSSTRSYNSNYNSLTYFISDDGEITSELKIYSGMGLADNTHPTGADFSSADDLQNGDEVIVYGKLMRYQKNSNPVEPEMNYPNYIYSLFRKTLESIAVKTQPTKTAYNVNDHFDPTGLVITLTYNNNETEDVAYAGNESDFTFTPTTSASLTLENTSVRITYDDKYVDQAITVTRIPTTLSWSAGSYDEVEGASTHNFPTLTTSPANLSGVTYSSSNTEVASINQTSGAITLTGATGETTITASFAQTAVYAAATPATYTLTITEDTDPRLEVDPNSLTFTNVAVNENDTKSFELYGFHLTADASLSIDGEGKDMFSVTSSIAKDASDEIAEDVEVTYAPTAAGTHVATLTITSGDVSKTVSLNGTAKNKYTITWKVNGTALTGSALTGVTTEVLDGEGLTTLPSVANNALNNALVDKFVGWSTSELTGTGNNAPSILFKTANAAPPIDGDKVFHAVFAKETTTGADVNTIVWAEDFSGWSNHSATPSGSFTNSHDGTTVYGSNTVTYTCVNGNSNTQLYGGNETLYAGGEKPELLVGKNTGSFSVSGIPNAGASVLTVSYKQNDKELTVSSSGTGYSGSTTNTPAKATTESFDVAVSSNADATFTLTFTPGSNNVRLDDIKVKVKTQSTSYTNYITKVVALSSIAISTPPTKTAYKKGETLNLTNMVVTATYADNSERAVTGYSVTPSTLTTLATTDDEFEVSYTEGDVTKTATQAIKVFALDKIEITAAPTTTAYLEGATFDKTGMVVEATWGTDGDKIVETLDAEDYTVDPSVLDATNITSVTISYTHEGVTKTTTQAVTVNERPSLTMSWKVGNADPTSSKIYINGDDQYLLALPAEDPDVPAGFGAGYVFKGWTSAASVAKDGSDFVKATAGTEMTEATTFHAVFALKNGEDAPAGYRLVNAAPANGETVIFARKVNNTYYAFNKSAGSSELTITDGVVTSTTDVLWDAKEQCNTTTATGLFYFVSGQTTNLIHINSTSFNITNSAQNGDIVFSANGDGSFTAARRNDSGTLDRWISANGTNAFGVTSTESSAVALYVFKYSAATVATYSNYRFAPSSVVAPEITLAEGTYYGVQSTTITQSQSKPIYYTLDGTNPTNASTLYEGAISLNEAGTKTIKAVAYDEATDDYSAFDEATYTIVTEIANPVLPASGKFYTESKEVEISHELISEGAEILYSYDGVNYNTYSSALNITETKTVYAKATIGSLTSEVVSATYTKGVVVNYNKLTSTDQLAAGMEFILVSVGGEQYVTAGALNSTYLDTLRIAAPVENVLAITRDVKVFTLDGQPAAWTMTSEDGTLFSHGDKKVNYSGNGDGTWNLTFSGETLTIANNGSGNGNLRYNTSSPRFTTYSGQTTVDIYYKEYATAYTLTYDVDGTENDKTVKVVEGYEYTIVNNVFGDAPEGGIDAYWKDANNNLYTVGDKIILTSNMTLTPVWSQVVRSSLAEGKMGTICPKQEVKYPTGASFYELTYKTIENGVPYKVFFDEIAEGASLVAGKPYLFVADGESITGVKVGDEATEGVNDYNGFHGILNPAHTTLSVTADDAANYKYYIITNNEIRLCGAGTFTIPVERAYIDMSALSAEQVAQSPGRRRVCLTNRAAETVTGVEELNASEAPVKVMIDGLLFIIRGEKMYNANGQVVK